MSDATSQTVYFYNRHPISCEIILTKLRASRGHLDGLRPGDLFSQDQGHYGGLAATDELALAAQVGNGSRVADFCAGIFLFLSPAVDRPTGRERAGGADALLPRHEIASASQAASE